MRYWPFLLFVLLLAACSSSPDEKPPGADEPGERQIPGMMGGEGMMDDGMMMSDTMPRWMMSEGMMGGMMQDMRVIRDLLLQHEQIEREVEEIPGGVRTTTTSSDPQVAVRIRTHVRQMKERMEEGQLIRRMDPLFRELFEHHEQIHLEYEEIPGGVRVIETSESPEVVSLIRQHARRFVNEVVEHGMRRAMQPTPLPEGYGQ